MRRFLRKQFLENCSRLETVCVALVPGIFRDCERQCVEDLRFMVLRIFCRDVPHGVAIGAQAYLLRRAFEVVVQLADGREIGAFALGLCAQLFASFGALPPELQLALVFLSRCERIAPIAKCDSPVRDCARRIFSQHCVKAFYGTAELEGMQQRYSAVEILLRDVIARCGKVYRSQFLTSPMLMLLRHAARCRQDQ